MRVCVICRASTDLVHVPHGTHCRQPIECNARARLRLGIPAGLVRAMRAAEWRTAIAEREARRAA